ncbi:hypothetical protein quinque_005864 [Culex quinquefasciatus]|uniref:uncharacterized protein LOC119768045 n=1 Tax=Culex quinquefasciatus TaxID=7176 RepID=UPI0018E37401|nr:uncharacterized protein LOC119768045 [Culex quinquefasciatus]
MQQQEKRRELRLKKFWRTTTKPPTSSEDSGGCESPTKLGRKAFQQPHQNSINSPARNPPTCSLPLLQVWPSQDSPRGEADGQSFVFPLAPDDTHLGGLHHTSSLYHPAIASGSGSGDLRRNSLFVDQLQAGDSGIDSVQASPSPVAMPCHPMVVSNAISPSASPTVGSPTPSVDRNNRRPSTSLLHPDHARLFALRQPTSPDQSSLEDNTEFNGAVGNHGLCTASSSTTSSLTSVAVATLGHHPQRSSDPWLRPERDKDHLDLDQRRASTMTARLSLFDALDLEYALLRAAARGSVGPYSLSESLHKLTFTQSLAFPALARGLASKRRASTEQSSTRPLNPNESGLNTFAKVVTACVLVMVSFLVFLVVYKYVRT